MDPSRTDSSELARELLRTALEDLRREARQVGRDALFDALLPALTGSVLPVGTDHRSDAKLARALRRLHGRLRERIEAQLRKLEPDPARRRALRQQLRATLSKPRTR